jgi:hypothetical protein
MGKYEKINLSIPTEFEPIWVKFLKIIEDDLEFKIVLQRHRGENYNPRTAKTKRSGLQALKVRFLIARYVKSKKQGGSTANATPAQTHNN